MMTEERFQKIMSMAKMSEIDLSEFLIANSTRKDDAYITRHHAILGDGTVLSIQAGFGAKSKRSGEYGYSHWEIGIIYTNNNKTPSQFVPYAEYLRDLTVCNYVPTELILEVINERGGTLELDKQE